MFSVAKRKTNTCRFQPPDGGAICVLLRNMVAIESEMSRRFYCPSSLGIPTPAIVPLTISSFTSFHSSQSKKCHSQKHPDKIGLSVAWRVKFFASRLAGGGWPTCINSIWLMMIAKIGKTRFRRTVHLVTWSHSLRSRLFDFQVN